MQPEAQVGANVNKKELGDLGLTDAKENAIVKFMQTLSDGYKRVRDACLEVPAQPELEALLF